MVGLAWRVEHPLYAFLHNRVSQRLLNVVQDFIFSCNEVGAILRPNNAWDFTMGYKSLNFHDANTGVL